MPSAGASVRWIGIAATAMSALSTSLGAAEAPSETPDARRDIVLQATGPHPSLGEEARTFDRLIGTWHCEYAVHGEYGTISRASGELTCPSFHGSYSSSP